MTTAPAFPRLVAEFPDYPLADLPPIPACWEDASWHNDASPFFIATDSAGVFVDYLAPAMRELDTGDRFLVVKLVDRMHEVDPSPALYSGDDWNAALAAILAHEFAATLRDQLDAESFEHVLSRNVTAPAGTCASHDVCDANMPMAEAFEAVMGREPMTIIVDGVKRFCSDVESPESEAVNEADSALWNAAWKIATPRYLTRKAGTMHPANDRRADWALEPVNVFARETYCGRTFTATVKEQPDEDGDAYTMIQDLIGDLLHLATRHGWDAHEMNRKALANYDHEAAPGYAGD